MDMLKQWNAAVKYIEDHLCGEIEISRAAGLACVTEDSFLRFFSYMTGMTVKEYIRRRRLTLAAGDLRDGAERVVDVAVKYGYNSAAAFSRAFAEQHGVTPSVYRAHGGALKVYPPVSFHMIIKGAKEMDFRMVETADIEVRGIPAAFAGQGYGDREALRHVMWSEDGDDVPGKLCEGRWNQPGSTAYDGVWYGIWQDGQYTVARAPEHVLAASEAVQGIIPAGTYAAFRTPCGGAAWEELPKLFDLIFDAWLPASEYRQRGDLAVEVYHLWTDHETRKKKRYYEVWVPVERK